MHPATEPYGHRIENPPISMSLREKGKKYKYQSRAVGGGVILMFVSGMQLGWTTFGFIIDSSWSANVQFTEMLFYVWSAWYMGSIIGSLIGLVLVDKFKKNIIYYLSGGVMAIGSLFLIISPTEFWSRLAGRMIIGMGHGIVYVALVIHSAEITVPEMRAPIMGTIGYMLVPGMLVALIVASFDRTTDVSITIGSTSLSISIVALIFTKICTYESPAFLMRSGHEREALDMIILLRGEVAETVAVRQDFEEVKEMINEEKSLNRNIFSDGNLRPLLLMISARLLYQLSNNLALNVILWTFTVLLVQSVEVGIIILILARTIGSCVPLFTLHYKSPKMHLTVSGIMSSLVLLAFGIILATSLSGVPDLFYIPGIFAILFQLFAAIGIDGVPPIYLGEAFAGPKSPLAITVVTIIEYLFGILSIYIGYSIFQSQSVALFVYLIIFLSAGVMFCFALILQLTISETKTLSLRMARNKFSQRYLSGMVYINSNMQGITYS